MLRYLSVHIFLKDRFSMHPKGEHKGASHAPDPNDVCRLSNWASILPQKQNPKWIAVSKSIQIFLINCLLRKKKIKKWRFVPNFQLPQLPHSPKCTKTTQKQVVAHPVRSIAWFISLQMRLCYAKAWHGTDCGCGKSNMIKSYTD